MVRNITNRKNWMMHHLVEVGVKRNTFQGTHSINSFSLKVSLSNSRLPENPQKCVYKYTILGAMLSLRICLQVYKNQY
jgi:hypothetical protein